MNGLVRLEDLLFGEGWGFFISYLAVYLAAWALNLPTPAVQGLFVLLHAIHGLLLAHYSWRHRGAVHRDTLIFWTAAALLTLLPGAYLEYPADPWEHFRRIFAWQQSTNIADNEFRNRMAYFWSWTTISWVTPVHRRLALDVLSSFWQLLVLFHFRGFLKRLGVTGSWLHVHALAFFVLFGHNLFGFRYYALSSTPLAFLAYFRFLTILDESLETRKPRYLALPLLLLLIYLNHAQELAFLYLSAGALITFRVFECLPPKRKRATLACLAGLVPLSLLFGYWLVNHPPKQYLRIGVDQLSPLGTFRVWARHGVFLETLGVHGVLGLLLSLPLLADRSTRRTAVLVFAPISALLLPPLVYVITLRITAAMDAYRLLYAMPSSIGLVAGLATIFRRLSGRRQLALVVVCVLTLSIPANFPWRGRLGFQLTRGDSERSLPALDQAAEWILSNRKIGPNCALVSDNATRFIISSHLGIDGEVLDLGERVRLSRTSFGRVKLDLPSLQKVSQTRHICGILIAHTRLIKRPSSGGLGVRSGHWPSELGDLTWQTTPEFEDSGPILEAAGWKKTEIPPFYAWYDPPGT